MIPKAVGKWLQEHSKGRVTAEHPVGGGCINNGTRLETESGTSFFLKTNSAAPKDMFAREAEGLSELKKTNGPRVPEAYLWDMEFILLEDLKPTQRAADYWESLGRQLGQLHQTTKLDFGFNHDNYLGTTRQPNPWTADGHEFFAEHRLRFQVRLARDNGKLTRNESTEITRLAGRLNLLVPPQPASLIHGDLWGGNAISDERGQPAVIDPAAYYGWAEAELGITALFSRFPEAFYIAYVETRPLDIGWADRLPIYNLYHLLNHLNLFGSGYHSQVMQVVKRFS
jgi:protein-ribulosamine 3-kinase